MRRGRMGGLCAACGDERPDGLFWESWYLVREEDEPGMVPCEPTFEPVRCDACEQVIRDEEIRRWRATR